METTFSGLVPRGGRTTTWPFRSMITSCLAIGAQHEMRIYFTNRHMGALIFAARISRLDKRRSDIFFV